MAQEYFQRYPPIRFDSFNGRGTTDNPQKQMSRYAERLEEIRARILELQADLANDSELTVEDHFSFAYETAQLVCGIDLDDVFVEHCAERISQKWPVQ